MKLIHLANLDARLSGGTDGKGGGRGPLVVLLHGFGAPGDDLVPLGQALGAIPGPRFLFPEAPIDLGAAYGGGRAWWRLDVEGMMRRQAQGIVPDIDGVPEGLDAARQTIDALLDEVETTLSPEPGKIVLGGFSQGAMLSLDVALRGTRALSGVVLLSGTHVAARHWATRFASRRSLPVFMSHGQTDNVLPYAVAKGLQGTLVANGFAVEWVTFAGGHGIPQQVVAGARAFITHVLA